MKESKPSSDRSSGDPRGSSELLQSNQKKAEVHELPHIGTPSDIYEYDETRQ